jgi:hypothetical protein
VDNKKLSQAAARSSRTSTAKFTFKTGMHSRVAVHRGTVANKGRWGGCVCGGHTHTRAHDGKPFTIQEVHGWVGGGVGLHVRGACEAWWDHNWVPPPLSRRGPHWRTHMRVWLPGW